MATDRRTREFWDPICWEVEREIDRIIEEAEEVALDRVASRHRSNGVDPWNLEKKYEQWCNR